MFCQTSRITPEFAFCSRVSGFPGSRVNRNSTERWQSRKCRCRSWIPSMKQQLVVIKLIQSWTLVGLQPTNFEWRTCHLFDVQRAIQCATELHAFSCIYRSRYGFSFIESRQCGKRPFGPSSLHRTQSHPGPTPISLHIYLLIPLTYASQDTKGQF